jgi:hypothetical protein
MTNAADCVRFKPGVPASGLNPLGEAASVSARLGSGNSQDAAGGLPRASNSRTIELNVCIRPQPAVAVVPAIAATTAGETSSDEILVERIAAGNKPAMQALFARHRTSVYRWLLRFVSNETLAEDLLSEVFLDLRFT